MARYDNKIVWNKECASQREVSSSWESIEDDWGGVDQ